HPGAIVAAYPIFPPAKLLNEGSHDDRGATCVWKGPVLTARHDFDALPTNSAIEVRPARHAEMPAVAAMARRMVPGVQIGEQGLIQHFAFDPESILVFRRCGQLLGGMAFLYLNARGHDALILGELTPTDPDRSMLAARDEEVS